MTFKPDYQATLDEYDKREVEIERILREQKAFMPEHEYRAVEQAFARERAAMAKRRPILEAWIKEDKEQNE